jgi:hypothetical protein
VIDVHVLLGSVPLWHEDKFRRWMAEIALPAALHEREVPARMALREYDANETASSLQFVRVASILTLVRQICNVRRSIDEEVCARVYCGELVG